MEVCVRVWPLLLLPLGLVACDDPTPNREFPNLRMVSIGSYFGECGGPCLQTITLSPLQLTIEEWFGEVPLAVQAGELTAAGINEVERVDNGIPATLAPSYGCPDCADGGGMRLTLIDGGRTEHDWEYSRPPAELEDVDNLYGELWDALWNCEANDWVTPAADCEPYSL